MNKSAVLKIFNYLLVFNIFAGAFMLFRTPFEFYLGYVFILLFLVFYVIKFREWAVNSVFLLILGILTVSSFVDIMGGNVTVFLVAKQVLGIFLTGVAYYWLVRANDFDVKDLFAVYLRVSLVVAAIGLLQELSYIINFEPGYNYKWIPFIRNWGYFPAEKIGVLRLNSICAEPAHYAISMAPAFFIAVLDIFKKTPQFLKSRTACAVIIISYILTFSMMAYISVVVAMLIGLRFKNFRHAAVAMIMAVLLLFLAYSLIPDIHGRVDNSMSFIFDPKMDSFTHMSVYGIFSNMYVALRSFMSNPLFGLGLGSHPVSYDRFFEAGVSSGFIVDVNEYNVLCKGDSGSLLLRLFSETGLFGVVTVLYFVFGLRIRFNVKSALAVMSNAIFILFVLRLFRLGHYFYNGLFYFVWIYYFAYKFNSGDHDKAILKNP